MPVKLTPSYTDNRRALKIKNAEPVADSPSDVLLMPKSDRIHLNRETRALFAAPHGAIADSLSLSLVAPDETMIRTFHHHTYSAGAYLSLYYGLNGNASMLKLFSELTPSAVSSLVPVFHDLIVRAPTFNVEQQQQQQHRIEASEPPHTASYTAVINACAVTASHEKNGTDRLREIERGARIVTHFLAHRRGLGKYLGKYDNKKDKATADKQLDAAIKAVNSGHEAFEHFLVNDTVVGGLLVSNKTKWKEMIKDVEDLFLAIIPPNGDGRGKEYQALCIAIVAVGVSNFGYQMVKRYETIEARAGKIIEIIGGVLGGLPHAGGVIAAVATIGKSMTDAIYEHKIDKVKVIQTLGKRITASFLLDKTDLVGEGCAGNESELYTRILSSIYGVAL